MAATDTSKRTKKEIEDDKYGPKDVDEFILVGGVDDIPANRPEAPELADTIRDASAAIEEKAKVLGVIQECRQGATFLMNRGRGSKEQVAWLRFYLPRKKRKVNGETDEDED